MFRTNNDSGKCDFYQMYVRATNLSTKITFASNSGKWFLIKWFSRKCKDTDIFGLRVKPPPVITTLTNKEQPIPLTTYSKKQQANLLVYLYTILLMFNLQQENCDYQLFTPFGLTRRMNRQWRSRGANGGTRPRAQALGASAHFLQSFKNAF